MVKNYQLLVTTAGKHVTRIGHSKRRYWMLYIDEVCKTPEGVAKLCITSLNSHFTPKESGTRCRSELTLLRWGQRTSTNRTHFLSWLNHYVSFALGALEMMEFDSFDFVRVLAIHLTLSS
jgi:hypothetical protein